MPRVDSRSSSTQVFHAQYPTLHGQLNPQVPKKKHICPTCDRAFTTSGHLARHSRVHTGERNHKCPFPGCETRCSRQDNLQQHYRIHLAPGSRRSSRSSVPRLPKRTTAPVSQSDSLSSPPPLEPARVYHSPPPDSPPPLAHATLPATAAQISDDLPTRSSSSPETTYSPLLIASSSNGYPYRSGTSTYQEQSQTEGYTYVHTTPLSQSSSSSSLSSYSSSQGSYSSTSLAQISTSASVSSQGSPSPASSVSLTSRHSIAHISPQVSYESVSSAGPPSPTSTSVSSHHSVPTTPTYSAYPDHEEPHVYHQSQSLTGQSSPSELSQAGYSPTIAVSSHGLPLRYVSPPPVLAPIHGNRGLRRDSLPSAHPYIHHPQPIPSDYRYQSSISLGHGSWKSDTSLRPKGIGALVQ